MYKCKCSVCGKEKDPLALRINEDFKTECIACASGVRDTMFRKEIEDYFILTQKAFFDSADKIWKRLGV